MRATLAAVCVLAVVGLGQSEPGLPRGAVARFGFGLITSLTCSPTERVLALGTAVGVEIRVVPDLTLLRFLPAFNVTDLAFSPTGGILAVAEEKGVSLWNTKKWEKERVLARGETIVALAMISEEVLALGSYAGVFCVITVEEKELWKTQLPEARWADLACSPDGRLLAIGIRKTVLILDTESGEEVLRMEAHDHDVHVLAFSPDGRLASGSWDGTVKVWDLSLNMCVGLHRVPASSLTFAPAGDALAIGTLEGKIHVWDFARGIRIVRGQARPIWALAFSPDGRYLYSASADGTVLLWEVVELR